LREWNVPKILALDSTAWRLVIHVPEFKFTPCFHLVLVFGFLLFMRGFISSLPQLGWEKGFDVVVVYLCNFDTPINQLGLTGLF
jgi:hypothetical protein